MITNTNVEGNQSYVLYYYHHLQYKSIKCIQEFIVMRLDAHIDGSNNKITGGNSCNFRIYLYLTTHQVITSKPAKLVFESDKSNWRQNRDIIRNTGIDQFLVLVLRSMLYSHTPNVYHKNI